MPWERRSIDGRKKYTYRVICSEEDHEFIGLCAEFPSLSWLSPTQARALSSIVKLVGEVLADMQANNEAPPEPLSTRTFSGRFVVRTTPEIHCQLVIRAEENGVSLNRYIKEPLKNSDTMAGYPV